MHNPAAVSLTRLLLMEATHKISEILYVNSKLTKVGYDVLWLGFYDLFWFALCVTITASGTARLLTGLATAEIAGYRSIDLKNV